MTRARSLDWRLARWTGLAAGFAMALFSHPVWADDGDKPWSATLYLGPSTNQWASKIFFAGKFDTDGAVLGLAADRRLARLGWGFTLEAEGQITQFVLGHAYTVASLGIGIRFSDFPWSGNLPTSIAVYTGPSYATDPPRSGLYGNQVLNFRGTKLLNYVGVELAVAIPHADGWQAAVRFFHRSGAFGIYTFDDDQGTAVGIGVRRPF
jgi:hypothetical protein